MSDIPMLRGWGDDIGDLGNGLSHLINPNAQVQNALRKAAMENPDLIPQLAEMERSNPGTLQSMGLNNGGILQSFGKGNGLVDQIKNTPISEKMRQNRELASATIDATKAGTRNSNASAALTEGETPGRVKVTTVAGNESEALSPDKIKSAKDKYALDSKQSQIQLDTIDSALKKFPSLSQIDFQKYAADVFNGKKIDPEVTQRIAASGEAGQEAVKQYLGAMHQHAELASRGDIAHLQSHDQMIATAGVLNSSLMDGLAREKVAESAGKFGDFEEKMLTNAANPSDPALKNSAGAIAARETLQKKKAAQEEALALHEANNEMTKARDKILASIPAAQKAGAFEKVTLSLTAAQLKQGIESGAIDPKTLGKSKAFNGLTKSERDELLKLKKVM